jgi:hypothetical protein
LSRNADTVFRSSSTAPFAFDDLSERSALKLTSLLRITAPRHFRLLHDEVLGVRFFREAGQFTPIYSVDLRVSDAPLAWDSDFHVDVEMRLARQSNADASVRRLLVDSVARVTGRSASGGEHVLLGETHKVCIFSRNDPDPGRRRVVDLHASAGLGALPTTELSPTTVDELVAPPESFRRDGADCVDSEAHVWSYQQTDPNRHVHAMDYVRSLDLFATDQLALRGRSPAQYFFDRARVVFRKPCFCGELYRRTGAHFVGPQGDLFAAAIHKLGAEGRQMQSEPAVAAQFHLAER